MPMLPPERSTGYLWRWCAMARNFMAAMIIRPSADITPEYVGTFGVLLHLTRRTRTAVEAEWEWDTTLSESTVTAVTGQIKYSGALIPDVAPVDDLTCDMTDITDGQTWYLFVEASLGAGTIELKVQAARPVDDPANKIIRVALSTWTRTGDSYTRDRILHRGAIQLTGVWNQ